MISAFIRRTILISKATFSSVSLEGTAALVKQQQQQLIPPRVPVVVPKSLNFRSSRRRLMRHGLNALLPTVEIKHPESYVGEDVNLSSLPGSERLWLPPVVSKRKAAMLRKEAIRTGTYGKFDIEKGGIGWDPMWDVEIAKSNPGCVGRYMAIRVPKKSARKKSREKRAQKIETAMVGMDERMEEIHAAKHRNKPPVTFESTYKNLMKVKK